MCLGATSSATICVSVNFLCLCNGINLVTETAYILFAVDTECVGMRLSVHFMVIARIQSGVVVNIVELIHIISFPLAVSKNCVFVQSRPRFCKPTTNLVTS